MVMFYKVQKKENSECSEVQLSQIPAFAQVALFFIYMNIKNIYIFNLMQYLGTHGFCFCYFFFFYHLKYKINRTSVFNQT